MSSTPKPPGLLEPGGFQSLTQPPSSQFSVGNVPAPTALYVGTDSFLRVSTRSILPANTLTVHTRMLRSSDGQITTSEDSIKTAANGVQQFANINLTEGFLLSAEITADTGTVPRGTMFVSMELCHGSGGNIHRDQLLMQDYIVLGYATAWPGGQIRQATEGPGTVSFFQSGAPGAGFEMGFAFNAGSRVLVKCVSMTFTTSAAVGNRIPTFNFVQAGANIYTVGVAAPIPASTVATINLAIGAGQPTVFSNNHLLPLPADLRLQSLATFQSLTAGILAGDNYSVQSGVQEQWVDA